MIFPPPGVLEACSADLVRTVFQAWFKKDHPAKSKDAHIAALNELFADPAQVAAAVAGWSPELRAAVAEARRVPEPSVAVLRAALAARGVHDGKGQIQTLLERGVLMSGHTDWYTRASVREILAQSSLPLVLAPGLDAVPEPPLDPIVLPVVPPDAVRVVHRGEPARLAAALVGLVGLASRRKLKMTLDGVLGVPSATMICRELGLAPPLFSTLLVEIARTGGLVEGTDRLTPTQIDPARLSLPALLKRALDGFVTKGRWLDDLLADDDVGALSEQRQALTAPLLLEQGLSARRALIGMLRRLSLDPPAGNLGSAEQGSPDRWVSLDALVEEALDLDPALGFRERRSGWSSRDDEDGRPRWPSDRSDQWDRARAVLARTALLFGLVELGSLTDTLYICRRYPKDWNYNHQFLDEGPYGGGPSKRPRWAPEPSNLVVRMTPLGRELLTGTPTQPASKTREKVHVGMDFEVVVPVHPGSSELTFRLDTAAVALPSGPADPVRRWRLDRERWLAALGAGFDGEGLLADLVAAATHGVPDNVVQTLAGWSATVGRLELYTHHDLVEFESGAARNAAVPSVSAHLGDRWAIVPRGSVAGAVTDYAGTPTPSLTVYADARIEADSSADLSLTFTLVRWADPEPTGGWRLSRTRLAGQDPAEIVGWLKPRLREPLPRGMTLAIRGWCGKVAAAGIAKVEMVLVDEDDADEIAAHPNVRPWLAGKVPGGVLLVAPGGRAGLLAALAELGIAVNEGLWVRPPEAHPLWTYEPVRVG